MELDAVCGGVFNFDNIIAQVNLANQNATPIVCETGLLPTQHVSKFDPAMSWEGKALRARPSRQPDNSNVVTLSAFGKIDTRTMSERRWGRAAPLLLARAAFTLAW
jgi:hypothetical protein